MRLQGVIDRIDTYENGEGIWLRVVDNKSSVKKPDPAKMADGEQLQLMIYLKAVLRAYPGTRPAGAMFFPVTDKETGRRMRVYSDQPGIQFYSGNYVISKVCGESISRSIKMHIIRPVDINFDEGLLPKYKYPDDHIIVSGERYCSLREEGVL